MELSIILNNPINSLFIVALFLAAPLLLRETLYQFIAYLPTGLLTGVDILLLYPQRLISAFWLVPLLTSALLTGAGAYLSYRKYVRAGR
jgi:hypothetical protein